MHKPEMQKPRRVAADTWMLGAWMPVPAFGVLPVNAFLLEAPQPLLVDTGLAALGDDFIAALESVIDPQRLRWIWLTHLDPDHVGNLAAVLARAPQARVLTNFLGMGKLGLLGLPQDRVRLINPGQSIDIGGRLLQALTPPCYDAPESLALYDRDNRLLFSADCFGALLDAPVEQAGAVPADDLRAGLVQWASVDAPWLRLADPVAFAAQLEPLKRLDADWVLGGHLPPAYRMLDRLIDGLDQARDAPLFVGPDQAALQALMASSG